MAKKFGKFVLLATAVSAAAATAYYYMQKKDSVLLTEDNDEDYDDFNESLEDTDSHSRTYVPLNRDNASETETDPAKDDFTPLTETVETAINNINNTEETVEEFFDEADPVEAASEISDDE